MDKIRIKIITDAHIEARLKKTFDNPPAHSHEEIIALMVEGKTFEKIVSQIEIGFISMTSIMTMEIFNECTAAYKKGIYKGFNEILK
jgi:hypothetical protein